MTTRPHLLSDDDLLTRTCSLALRRRRAEAELVAHLAEVDHRRLYLREACPSMFVYATTRLGLSEAEAYHRITVARAARRFPSILSMLASGEVHLSAVARVAAHLTENGADALLARVAGRSRREIDAVVAELAPKPDVRTSVRPIAGTGPTPANSPSDPAGQLCLDRVATGPRPAELAPTVASDPPLASNLAPPLASNLAPPLSPSAASPPALRLSPPCPPSFVVPIAPARFKVQFTASSELEAKIARATALLRHRIPSGDLAAVFDFAFTVLLADLEGKKCAATPAPRRSLADTDFEPVSRHVPAASRRAIWQRDEGRCTFVDQQGRRCPARERLEFHHEVPFARGGDHSPDNVRLLCHAHNAYRAELDYGRDIIRRNVEAKRAAASHSRGHAGPGPQPGTPRRPQPGTPRRPQPGTPRRPQPGTPRRPHTSEGRREQTSDARGAQPKHGRRAQASSPRGAAREGPDGAARQRPAGAARDGPTGA